MYPDKIDLIYVNWPKVANAIMLEATERRIQINEPNLGKHFYIFSECYYVI